MSIQVGDKVICVDDSSSFKRLTKGATYVVEAAYNGEPVVIVGGSYHSIERFVKA